ncbi:hypothetical protein SAMN04487948_106116 [Halogranum amylolyticum]|uniref:Uncharacterized protein n=1 Tax=Halogranum amylolyticum TaxID=660520 RepID=A0A1H8TB51_9EURY|nr:hypothetical protein [Halogranum amylolyticum]SEO87713.1 hypothetical protein SAMN04487948_106116 [Halogranum amylolyticum]
MGDTKRGREKQARQEKRRQRRREMEAELDRGDEPEPEPTDDERVDVESDSSEGPPECHRRGCHDPAAFVVLERYLEETSHSPVEATAMLCVAHTEEEGPTRLEAAYDDYVFRIEPLPERES